MAARTNHKICHCREFVCLLPSLLVFTVVWSGAFAQPSGQRPGRPGGTPGVKSSEASGPEDSSNATKLTLAVFDFEFGSVRSEVAATFRKPEAFGRFVAELVMEDLVKLGAFRVVDQSAIQKLMDQRALSFSDLSDTRVAARVAKELGADAILIGTVAEFGRQDRNTHFGHLGIGSSSSTGKVGIAARVISVESGEILGSTVVDASKKGQSSTRVGVARRPQVEVRSKEFAATALGGATSEAASLLAARISSSALAYAAAHRLSVSAPLAVSAQPRQQTAEGAVALVDETTVVVTVGSKNGVKVGDRLTVHRAIKAVHDPADQSQPLPRMESIIGSLIVLEAKDGFAIARFSGSSAPVVGDTVRRVD